MYRVDVINGTCTCKSWYYGVADEKGLKLCKHLRRMLEVEKDG